jgi:hypothetical protein
MSVIHVTKNDVENFTLVTTPSRVYTSSSTQGVTGSVKVFPRLSSIEKDSDSFVFSDTSSVLDTNFSNSAKKIVDVARTNRSFRQSISSLANSYFDLVSLTSAKKTAVLDIERFTPTTRLTKYTLIKNNIKDVLMPFYRTDYPNSHWAYTNYHSLNFFTAFDGTNQLVPTASVLLYPNVPDDSIETPSGHASGSYLFKDAFTFDFYINPRYKEDGIDSGHFKAGTIFHLSSSYCLSLATGSKKDPNGLPIGFRLQLQLSHSADRSPSRSAPGSYPNDLIFLSSDNALSFNNWHHVIVRWGTNSINNGTGSFIIDGINKGDFVIPSSSILPASFSNSLNPDVLCIGNYYEGTNAGVDAMSLFFNPDNARRDGVDQLTSEVGDPSYGGPVSYRFAHPLKAEIHDLAFRRYYISDAEIEATGSRGIGYDAFSKKNISFYLPPFFVENTTIKRFVGEEGGILQTPFFEIDGTTDDPFNVAMSFGVNGHYINLDNFVKDFSTGRFPRLLNLTGSTIDHTTDAKEANYFLYSDGGVAKRNLTILPCDDGNFDPNYEILTSEVYTDKFSASGFPDFSYINLDNLVSTASLSGGGIGPDGSDSYVEQLYGPGPEKPGLEPGLAYKNYIAAVTASLASVTDDTLFNKGVQKGVPLTIYQRTLDPSSNQVTIFNISNLYYGRRIMPGSFEIKDPGISGSFGSIPITLRDDSLGNIYRADSFTSHATQNSVGNIFYDEGIVLIKSPHLYFFGKNEYEVSFRGVYNIFSSKYEIVAGSGLLNSSSNPTFVENYERLKPSGNAKDDESFVYISGLNFHDENMNVVAKARLAQPIIKREGDRVLFKVAFDY